MFLREIQEVQWHTDDGHGGHYLRESEPVAEGIRRVTVIGEVFGEAEVSAQWLVFSRPVFMWENNLVGHVEIAFNLDAENQEIRPVNDSRLVVFFPTALETHVGFLMQGPFQTTPSRDNVPPHIPWNKHLVNELSVLLCDALRWLRDKGDLTTDVLRCLPIDSQRFGAVDDSSSHLPSSTASRPARDINMFNPLFYATKQALSTEPLLPSLTLEYVPANRALLGRTGGVRELCSPAQLSALFGIGEETAWLSGDITSGRAPEIRNYLMSELGVEEVDPETLTRKLSRSFLEEQPNSWILKLYEFLNGQRAIIRMLTGQLGRSHRVNVPLIRLSDGTHVPLEFDGQASAFLPGDDETDFPTVHPSVCETQEALDFLSSLGLREPDLVDDVKQNVLHKYQQRALPVSDGEYESDITRILRAFNTDSTSQRKMLLEALQRCSFVKSRVPGTSQIHYSTPDQVYLPTEQLNKLFGGIENVQIVDDRAECLRGQEVRKLLEACGATSYLKPAPIEPDFSVDQLRRMRKGDGSTRDESISDWTLMGLNHLLRQLQSSTQIFAGKKLHCFGMPLFTSCNSAALDISAGHTSGTIILGEVARLFLGSSGN